MTLKEFFKKLQSHDWFYAFSDDSRVFRDGEWNERCLLEEARYHGNEYVKLFNDYYDSMFSGPGFDCPKVELPVLSD